MHFSLRLFVVACWRLLLVMLLLLWGGSGVAQLCTGSLGDPVVNITFGAGSKPANPLGTGVTDYTYVAKDCPDDGSYTIRNSTSRCFGDTWHSLSTDHTGDGGGYFMMVNASYTPGNFYVHHISGLCANTTYEFAAWLLNLARNPNTILPDITFSIESRDGTVLKSYNTGDLPVTASPLWVQHGFFFKTPENANDVVLKITNNAPGGIGNDLLLDDITFRPCGPELFAQVINSPDTVHMCQEAPFPVALTAEIGTGYNAPVLNWQQSADSGKTWQDVAGATSPALLLHPKSPGTYAYRLSAAEKENSTLASCRVVSNNLYVYVHPTPVANAGPDKIIIKGNETRLGGHEGQGGISYLWQPAAFLDNAASPRPRIRPEKDEVYTLSATSAYGCSSTDAAKVQVVDQLFVPNAFTPNGDGHNDVWRIPFLDPELGARVSVYNRYGQLVYSTTGTVNWDGTLRKNALPAGTFVYQIQLQHSPAPIKGIVNLIR